MVTSRLLRWCLMLVGCDYDILYRPEKARKKISYTGPKKPEKKNWEEITGSQAVPEKTNVLI